MTQVNLSRRPFLTRSAAAVSGLAVGLGLSRYGFAENPVTQQTLLEKYKPVFFNEAEWRFVVAACDSLIPADENGPGALDALAPVFIDRQMQTEYGTGGLWYMHGPFRPSEFAPEFGYQYKFAPRDIYRHGIAEINVYCGDARGNTFDRLENDGQVKVLQDLEKGSVELATVPAPVFFNQLLANTKEGFFADPLYGGNQGMVGWKMIGFPGARGDYLEFVKQHNQPFTKPPVSIENQQGL